MSVFIKTTYTGLAAAMARGAGVATRTMQVILRRGYVKSLLHWHEKIRPDHFREFATSEYGYSRRSPEYSESKRESKGHTRPLVWSGESERATEQFQVRPTSKGATLAMAPGNLAFAKAGKINPRKEVTTTTQEETEEMAFVFQRSVDNDIRRLNMRHTTLSGKG